MRVVQVSPGPALAPFVRFLGYYEMAGPSVRERVLPSGGSQLLVNLHEDEMRTYDAAGRPHRTPGAALQVGQQRPEVIDTAQQRSIVVACFRPGGSYPF